MLDFIKKFLSRNNLENEWKRVIYPQNKEFFLFGIIPIRIFLLFILIIVETYLIAILSDLFNFSIILEILIVLGYFYLLYRTIAIYKIIVDKSRGKKNFIKLTK